MAADQPATAGTAILMAEELRVLLIEDSADDAALLERELRRGGYEPSIRRIEHGEELRAALGSALWDAVICDWTLPGFSAPHAIEILKQEGFDGPIVIVSGTMGEAHVVEAMRAGADDYVVKGDLTRLSTALERELREVAIRTAGRRAEGRLAVSEARLRSLLDTIPAATYVAVASDGKAGSTTQYISRQITGMIGYTPEEIVREPDLWFDILHPDDRDAVLRADAAHLASSGSAHQEYRVIAREGRVVWLRDEATMVPGEDGHPEFSQGILSDITDAKATEQTLRRQALIFDNVHDAVLIVDLEGRILDLNPGAEMMFRSSSDEVRGTVPDFLSGIEPHPRVLATVSDEGRWSGEVEVPSDDEVPRVAELIVVPLKDADGEMLGMVGVLRDVTQRKRAEEEVRRSVEQLRASDQERRQLVSRLVAAREEEARRIASEIHDDPIQKLSAAALRLGMLAKEDDPQKRAETIAQVRSAVDATLSRLRHMLFELTPRTLETDGLGEALKEYVEHANREGSTRYDLKDELRADLKVENRIIAYRVILEAMSNVRKHASAARATVSLADLDGGARFSVIDDGKGIAAENLGVSLPGHMGTASMRQHVEMAGGWITLASVPGEGTTVEFWLPRS